MERQLNTHGPDMRSVKAAAKTQFANVKGVEGFGIGDQTLRVYVCNATVQRQLPERFQGVPVEFVITGHVTDSY